MTFDKFVSSVPGKLVTRFGSRTYIGARITEGGPEWDPDDIVALTGDELATYRREYARALRDGALVERTRDEWMARLKPARGDAEPAPTRKKGTDR